MRWVLSLFVAVCFLAYLPSNAAAQDAAKKDAPAAAKDKKPDLTQTPEAAAERKKIADEKDPKVKAQLQEDYDKKYGIVKGGGGGFMGDLMKQWYVWVLVVLLLGLVGFLIYLRTKKDEE